MSVRWVPTAFTRQPTTGGTPNLDHRCSTPWLLTPFPMFRPFPVALSQNWVAPRIDDSQADSEVTPGSQQHCAVRKGDGLFPQRTQYWVRAMDFAPYFWNERDDEQISTQVKTLTLATEIDAEATVAALNSSLFFWCFLLLSDCRQLNLRDIESFPVGVGQMRKETKVQLATLTTGLMESFKRHSRRKETRYKATGKVVYDEFDQKLFKHIVDKMDRVQAEQYGFTEEKLDFIINYDIKYRMRHGASHARPSA